MMTSVPYQGEPATIPVSQLTVAPQIRQRNGFDAASIKELASSIQTHGLMQPIIVQRTGAEEFQIVAGHRRFAACQQLKMQAVPVLIREAHGPAETRAAQAVENLQRVDLKVLDKAEAVAALVAEVGAKRAAELLSKSGPWVSKHVALTKMHADIKALAENGTTDDLEILHALKSIRRLNLGKFSRLAVDLQTGQADRISVRSVLAMLQAAAKGYGAPGRDGDDESGDDAEGDDKGSSGADAGNESAAKRTLTRDEVSALLQMVRDPQVRPAARMLKSIERKLDGYLKRQQ